jgi:hypothetical protein
MARQVQISIDESSSLESPVHIYWVGPIAAKTTLPELVKVGQLDGLGKPLQLSSWVGTYLLAAQGGKGNNFPYNGDPGGLCALEVWLITHDISQSFILDLRQSATERRTVRGLKHCQIRRRVEFVNGAGSSIDIVFVPPDGPSPEAVEVNLSPGDMKPIYTWEGHRFRAVSRDGISCNGETDFVVEATHPRFYRHVFCAGHVASPTDDKGTPPVEWDGHPIDEL